MFLNPFGRQNQIHQPTSGGVFIALGSIMVLFSILIVIMPQLLALLVASVILFAGVALVSFGVKLKRLGRSGSSIVLSRFEYEDQQGSQYRRS